MCCTGIVITRLIVATRLLPLSDLLANNLLSKFAGATRVRGTQRACEFCAVCMNDVRVYFGSLILTACNKQSGYDHFTMLKEVVDSLKPYRTRFTPPHFTPRGC